jgi:outer membrane protein OmpA-like peptidoglycan-associated protein/nitrous oxidase accessory protein NosD
MKGGLLRKTVGERVPVLRVSALVAVTLVVGLLWVGESGARQAATTRTVCNTSPADFPTIQEAVDAASSGDTITVCNGTYQEQVTIPDSLSDLTLSAESKGAVIKAPSSLTGEKAIVEVAGAANVTIRGFTIRGPGGGDCDSLGFGVKVDHGGSATVDSNDILDIRDEPFSGCQNGVGIATDAGTGGSVVATSNLIKDFQKTGISVKGDGSVNTIKDNTIVGAGSTDVIAQNGIAVSAHASATVSGNTISDTSYSPYTVAATGIYAGFDPGDVTIENNTLHNTQVSIYIYGVSTDAKVTVSGNTITGGNDGIDVVKSSGVRIADNTTDGEANFGLQATDDASGNTFDGNKATGVTGEGNYDCADQSMGDKTARTANTWTGNTGTTVSPEGICSPTPTTPTPPTTTEPTPPTTTEPTPPPTTEPTPPTSTQPTPPANTEPTPPSGSGGGETGPIDELQVPDEIVVSDTPVTPENTTTALNPSDQTTPTGSQSTTPSNNTVVAVEHPTTPTKQPPTQKTSPVTVNKKLRACTLVLTTTDGQNRLVARGFAIAPKNGSGRLIISVRVVPAGKQVLAAHFGGVGALASARCLTTSNGRPTGYVIAFRTIRVVLQVEQVVTAPGTFLPDKAVLTPTGKEFLRRVRLLATNPLLLRCDGYTAVYPTSPVNAHTLSTQRAQVACRTLKQTHLLRPARLVPHGHNDPIATNSTEAGRSVNRRVVITLVHRIRPQV